MFFEVKLWTGHRQHVVWVRTACCVARPKPRSLVRSNPPSEAQRERSTGAAGLILRYGLFAQTLYRAIQEGLTKQPGRGNSPGAAPTSALDLEEAIAFADRVVVMTALYRLEMMLINLGLAALSTGDLREAELLFAEGLRIANKVDDRVAQ